MIVGSASVVRSRGVSTVERTVKVLELLLRIAAAGNVNAMTDAYVAIGMAEAAVQGAAANVRVNVASLDDASTAY